ncbi:MAG TPA: hypothetical protein VIJ14_03075 [Rhabdochlamydiaceae bacterium]
MQQSFFKLPFLVSGLMAASFCLVLPKLSADQPKQGKVVLDQLKDNPAFSLNPMDVPFFQQDDNPLKDMGTFAVVLLMRFDSPEVRKKADALIEKELSGLGRVIKADQKRIDLRGVGSRNFLILDSGEVKNSEGKLLPISRVSLRIQTPVTLTKTGINTLPNVWSINDFFDSPSEVNSEDKILAALQRLLTEFKSNYNFVNINMSEKPSFYLYY